MSVSRFLPLVRHLAPPFDAYAVDAFGRVWSFKRGRLADPVELAPHTVYGGGYSGTRRCEYRRVTLHGRDGSRRHILVHVAVALAFHGPPPPGAVVRHLDGDSLNCYAGNLAYGTVEENVADRLAHGWTYADREAAP